MLPWQKPEEPIKRGDGKNAGFPAILMVLCTAFSSQEIVGDLRAWTFFWKEGLWSIGVLEYWIELQITKLVKDPVLHNSVAPLLQ
jgi:hypothetical protein